MSHIFFPDHLWIIIFNKFENPIKILRLREVSSKLEVLIEEYFEGNKLWEKFCEDNIKLWAYQIMDKVRPKKLTNTVKQISSQADWKEIFLHYCKWRSQSTFTSLALEVDYTLKFSTDERITCTTVWRKIKLLIFIVFYTLSRFYRNRFIRRRYRNCRNKSRHNIFV